MKRVDGNITMKERKATKLYISTGNKREAVMRSYNTKSRHNAGQIAKQVFERPVVKEYLKQLLDKKGLSLDDLGDKLKKSINTNLDFGKPSQAVGADLLKFSYKLHDAVPANKNLNVTAKVGGAEEMSTDLSSLTETLKELTESNRLILESLNK